MLDALGFPCHGEPIVLLTSTPWARLLAAALLTAVLAAPAAAARSALQPAPLPPADIAQPERLHVAQSQEAAQLAVRIQQLEEQIRLLTGQVEGLTFQVTQMQTQLEAQAADNEFRFQQLEGGAGGKPQAATESGGATPAAELPQTPDAATAADPNAIPVLPDSEVPMDNIGDSQDPLVGAGTGTEAPLGGTGETLGGGQPLNLSLDGTTAENADAAAQYQAGFDAFERGDYAFAEEQFRQFIALYPEDAQAPDATNLLGEALMERGAFDEAADVLLTGFQNYPQAERAPDMLLRLGVALSGAGENETACRTFAEVLKRYPNASQNVRSQLSNAQSRAKCGA
jgi:tol-pal system protein YbgF